MTVQMIQRECRKARGTVRLVERLLAALEENHIRYCHWKSNVRLAESLPPAKVDARQLQQVFLNLINNAVAAMPDGGTLTIQSHLEKKHRRVAIQFRDTGCGIKPADIDHIFEPFFTTKPEGQGTGLGLFVSYGIIAKYGGTIDCTSRYGDNPGKPSGTRFTVKLATA